MLALPSLTTSLATNNSSNAAARTSTSQSPVQFTRPAQPSLSTSTAPVTSTNQSVLNAVFNLPSLSNFRNLTQIRNQTQAVSQNKGRAQSSTNSSSDTSSTPSSLDATSNLLSNISRLIAKDTEPERSSAVEQSEILPDCILKFEFEKPDGPEADEQRSYEIASRMLFLSAKWIKNFSSYHSIEVDHQVTFMLHTWSELFLIGIAQCISKDEMKSISDTLRFRLFEDELIQDLDLIERTVLYIQDLELGPVEYALCRCLLFLNPLVTGTREGADQKIEKLLNDTTAKISSLISNQRQQKIFMRINLCKQIHKKSIEREHTVFFDMANVHQNHYNEKAKRQIEEFQREREQERERLQREQERHERLQRELEMARIRMEFARMELESHERQFRQLTGSGGNWREENPEIARQWEEFMARNYPNGQINNDNQ
ncbi:Oidioi.mRNA.OKI2018_I69.XSR.g14890.t1.cds [Oikopleura dioica]|uniref:Oidioi.mRNA.OKI2018_I69.XSR.g14890.t1.cds n=1 Tax=Oikopleura dioica TaxID=34765 RepID=A0ABN7SB31_OIKDI|nr:Oidioi.mRNA.OKI2018_I69.XSR.g14890.t1.cds [Oikopleura dioica]